MATVFDVAEYILAKTGEMTAMKLQKLCYYAHAWHLVWEERPLFSERIEAWANGPIVPKLYAQHRGQFKITLGTFRSNMEALDAGEKDSIDLVIGSYGKFTAHQLSERTHTESPWIDARAGLALMERGNRPITDSAIYEYFDALTSDQARERGEEAQVRT